MKLPLMRNTCRGMNIDGEPAPSKSDRRRGDEMSLAAAGVWRSLNLSGSWFL